MTIVKRVGVLSLGKVLGLLYALLGLLLGGLFSLISLAGSATGGGGRGGGAAAILFSGAAIVVLPVLYGALGFIGGVISAALYNVIASVAGGIELELDQTGQPPAFPTAGRF